MRSRLQRYAYAILGDIACDAITPLEILRVCRQAEQRGHLEVAHKLRQYCGQVMRYAVANGWATRDPNPDIKGALTPKPTRHLQQYSNPIAFVILARSTVTHLSLRVPPYSYSHSRLCAQEELRQARWEELIEPSACGVSQLSAYENASSSSRATGPSDDDYFTHRATRQSYVIKFIFIKFIKKRHQQLVKILLVKGFDA